MRMDIDSRLISAVKTSKDQMVLTFQVINPSINYTVGEKYTLAEALFEMASRRRAGGRSRMASQAGHSAKKTERRGRPTNKERIRKYIAEHGGTAEHAAKVLHIKQ
jgi:hypothetical protein